MGCHYSVSVVFNILLLFLSFSVILSANSVFTIFVIEIKKINLTYKGQVFLAALQTKKAEKLCFNEAISLSIMIKQSVYQPISKSVSQSNNYLTAGNSVGQSVSKGFVIRSIIYKRSGYLSCKLKINASDWLKQISQSNNYRLKSQWEQLVSNFLLDLLGVP